MTNRNYYIYDVFTSKKLSGNPLAVVTDCEGLENSDMQKIASEFNLSETAFVFKPQHPGHTAKIRIFTPRQELPFAGHPTVGTAVALAQHRNKSEGEQAAILVLEEGVGPVRCAVKIDGDRPGFAEFDLPRLPEPVAFSGTQEAVAAALGVGHHEIGFENHTITGWSAGVPFICIPLANLDTALRARLDGRLWAEFAPSVKGILADAYVYCRETVHHDHAFHVRMFAPGAGIPEDPATGSAAAAFAGAIVMHDTPVDGSHPILIEQGIEMGRPSSIRLELDVKGGSLESARIGGHAVKIAEGKLFV